MLNFYLKIIIRVNKINLESISFIYAETEGIITMNLLLCGKILKIKQGNSKINY